MPTRTLSTTDVAESIRRPPTHTPLTLPRSVSRMVPSARSSRACRRDTDGWGSTTSHDGSQPTINCRRRPNSSAIGNVRRGLPPRKPNNSAISAATAADGEPVSAGSGTSPPRADPRGRGPRCRRTAAPCGRGRPGPRRRTRAARGCRAGRRSGRRPGCSPTPRLRRIPVRRWADGSCGSPRRRRVRAPPELNPPRAPASGGSTGISKAAPCRSYGLGQFKAAAAPEIRRVNAEPDQPACAFTVQTAAHASVAGGGARVRSVRLIPAARPRGARRCGGRGSAGGSSISRPGRRACGRTRTPAPAGPRPGPASRVRGRSCAG